MGAGGSCSRNAATSGAPAGGLRGITALPDSAVDKPLGLTEDREPHLAPSGPSWHEPDPTRSTSRGRSRASCPPL